MEKVELRKIYKQKRKDLSDDERAMLSQMITDNLLEHEDISNQTVSVFLPIERLQEINTWNIIHAVDAVFVVPVVKDYTLKHIILESEEQLEISEWGIPEPTFGEEVNPDVFDIVLVPLLVCDEKGNRVGYGAGFYDGFLKECSPNCKFIGLSYFDPIPNVSDIFEGDIPLHCCVTPNSVHSFI